MSLARWGADGSDVYVYWTDDRHLECCGCKDGKNLTPTEMAEHLKRHIAKGDVVPPYTLEAVEDAARAAA